MKSNTASVWSTWLPAASLLVASWIAITGLTLQARPGADVVAVMFPPWWSSTQTFAAAVSANVAIVRLTAVPSILVVRSEDDGGLMRLQRSGAWFTLDPKAIAACFQDSKDI